MQHLPPSQSPQKAVPELQSALAGTSDVNANPAMKTTRNTAIRDACVFGLLGTVSLPLFVIQLPKELQP